MSRGCTCYLGQRNLNALVLGILTLTCYGGTVAGAVAVEQTAAAAWAEAIDWAAAGVVDADVHHVENLHGLSLDLRAGWGRLKLGWRRPRRRCRGQQSCGQRRSAP